MFIFFAGKDKKKLQAVINYIYQQINESELESEALMRRAQFLAKELELTKNQEAQIQEELAILSEKVSKLLVGEENDVQSE